MTRFSWRCSSATSARGEPAVSVVAGIVVVATTAAAPMTPGTSSAESVDGAELVAVAVDLTTEVELVLMAVFVSASVAAAVVVGGSAVEGLVEAPTDASLPLVSTSPAPAVTETRTAIAVLHTKRRRFSG